MKRTRTSYSQPLLPRSVAALLVISLLYLGARTWHSFSVLASETGPAYEVSAVEQRGR